MGGGGGTAPPEVPDPYETATASALGFLSNAYAQTRLNNANTYTPYGNTTFGVERRNKYHDKYGWRKMQRVVLPDGRVKMMPLMRQTVTLSPDEQAKLDQQNRLQLKMGDLAESQLGRIEDALSTPFDFDQFGHMPEYDRDRYEEALFSRIDPMIQRDRQARDAQLAAGGIGLGSKAYEDAIRLSEQGVTDARYQAILNAGQYAGQEWGQAMDARNARIGEALQERNMPLQEIAQLMGQSTVNNPQVPSYRAGTIQPWDTGQNIWQAYNAEFDQWKIQEQMRQQQQQAAMSGAFGIGNSLIGGLFSMSDRRVKFDIVQVGTDPRGFGIYSFRYTFAPVQRHVGVMAQEVLPVMPEAVAMLPNGILAVNYGALYGRS